jgi:hypothetical protein
MLASGHSRDCGCLPSSVGAGVDSADLSASFAFGFAFANDLKRSPAVWLFFAPDFESDLFSVLLPADDWGVDLAEVLSSVLRAGAADSVLGRIPMVGFVAGFGGALEAAAGGGADLAVLRYWYMSAGLVKCSQLPYLDIWILYRSIRSPPVEGIFFCTLGGRFMVARCEHIQVLFCLAAVPSRSS